MYFSISKQNFYKPLDYISGPAQGAGQDSINGNVLLNVIKNNNRYPNIDSQYVLELVCTDNDIEMKSIIGIYSDEVVEGGITVKVKSLLDIIKSFEDETFITIKYDESDNRVYIKTNSNDFNICAVPANGFPRIDTSDMCFDMKIRRKELLTIMETTQSAILQENYRYYLKGMRFSFDKNNPMEVNIFTSDAHRVSIQKGILNEPCIVPEDYITGGFIIPKKGVTEIIKLLSIDKNNPDEEIVLSVSDNSLNTVINGICIVCKLIKADVYPDFFSFIPQVCNKIMVLKRTYLKSCLKRVIILSNHHFPAVKFVIKNGLLTIKCKNNHHEEAKELIDLCSYEGDDIELAFNPHYIIDVCDNMTTEKLKISLSDMSSCALIEPLPNKDEEVSYARYLVNRVKM